MAKRYDTEAIVQDILVATTRLFVQKDYEKNDSRHC